MGSGLSGDADVLTLQQQRVQFLLLQQFQEVRQMPTRMARRQVLSAPSVA